MATHGYSDSPTKEDKLGLNLYAEGIANFIKECATPMTLSIQGDWGSGKTSLFNLIDSYLKEHENKDTYCKEILDVVKINTWQFSVAGYQDGLVQVLISEILSSLNQEGAGEVAIKKAKRALQCLGKIAFAYFTQTRLEDTVNDPQASAQDFTNHIGEIKQIKESLHTAIEEAGKHKKEENSRLVVFVDDLDRLEPEVSVSLMEGMKNFLDCEGCVFVLAIDEKVVFDGIKKKYGKELGEERKQMFFDKLIQVPFLIPKAAYDVKAYVTDLLGKEQKSYVNDCSDVLTTLVPSLNPRSIKRYFNHTHLYQVIAQTNKESEVNNANLPMLLAATILLLEDRYTFDSIADCSDLSDVTDELKEDLNTDERKIKWNAIEDFLRNANSDEQETSSLDKKKFKDFLSSIKQVAKMQDTSTSLESKHARTVANIKRKYDLDETLKTNNHVELGNDNCTKILRVAKHEDRKTITITIYKNILSDTNEWKPLIEQYRQRGKWRYKEGAMHATRIFQQNENVDTLLVELEPYFEKIRILVGKEPEGN